MAASYYEQLCKKKTKLYPNGVKIGIMQRYAREADKAELRRRKRLIKGEYGGTE